MALLAQMTELARGAGWSVVNADCTVMAERAHDWRRSSARWPSDSPGCWRPGQRQGDHRGGARSPGTGRRDRLQRGRAPVLSGSFRQRSGPRRLMGPARRVDRSGDRGGRRGGAPGSRGGSKGAGSRNAAPRASRRHPGREGGHHHLDPDRPTGPSGRRGPRAGRRAGRRSSCRARVAGCRPAAGAVGVDGRGHGRRLPSWTRSSHWPRLGGCGSTTSPGVGSKRWRAPTPPRAWWPWPGLSRPYRSSRCASRTPGGGCRFSWCWTGSPIPTTWGPCCEAPSARG